MNNMSFELYGFLQYMQIDYGFITPVFKQGHELFVQTTDDEYTIANFERLPNNLINIVSRNVEYSKSKKEGESCVFCFKWKGKYHYDEPELLKDYLVHKVLLDTNDSKVKNYVTNFLETFSSIANDRLLSELGLEERNFNTLSHYETFPTDRTKHLPSTLRKRAHELVEESALNELFLDEIKDIYWAEKHLAKALLKFAKSSTSKELRDALIKQQLETEYHIIRLEDAVKVIGEKAVAKKCLAMEGLIREANDIIEGTEKGSITRDVGIISICQKIKHYEIASYGTLKTLASVLSYPEVANLLNITLEEERATDERLFQISLIPVPHMANAVIDNKRSPEK